MEEFNKQNTVIIEGVIRRLIGRFCDCEAMQLAMERYPEDTDNMRINAFMIARAISVCVNMSRRMYGSEYNIDCWANFFMKGKFAYVIPSMSGYESFEPKEWMKDFCYFNNADRPDVISSRRWKHRENIWGYFLSENNEKKTKISYQPIEMRSSFGDLELRGSITSSSCLLVDALKNLKNKYQDKNEFYQYNPNMIISLLDNLTRAEDSEDKKRRFIGLDALKIIKESFEITEDEWIKYWVNSDLKMSTKEKTEYSINNWIEYKDNPLNWILKNDTEYGYFYKVFKKRVKNEETRKINTSLL
jgi:hypothetical protein